MKRFFDPSPSLLTPRCLVSALTGRKPEDLSLPDRAIITFNRGDFGRLAYKAQAEPVEAWTPFRKIHRVKGKDTIIVRSNFGGPNIAALIEELAAFGVKEFIVWGYCGAIDADLGFGDIVAASGALREDGVSSHYLDDESDVVSSNWFGEWENHLTRYGFASGIIWSCDAIYRETTAKIARYGRMGVKGVEMEAASFYSVCRFLDVRGIAFLVVSDCFTHESWSGGFRSNDFRVGAKRFSRFILDEAIR